LNIDLGSSSWHNFSAPQKSLGLRESQQSGESFTGNAYLSYHGRKRDSVASKKKLSPAVICEISGIHPDSLKKSILTYDRFGGVQYTYEVIK